MGNLDINISDSFAWIKKFFEKEKRFSVGVDIGTSSIKIVELEKRQDKIFLKNYATVKTHKELVQIGKPGLINEEAGVIIKKVFEKAGIKQERINVAIPCFSSLVTSIELPRMTESEIDHFINVEASKYIPVPINEVVFGWEEINVRVPLPKVEIVEEAMKPGPMQMATLGEEAKASKPAVEKIKVLLVAVMKDISSQYEKVLGKAGFKVDCIEVDSFSLKRSLVGKDKGTYLILDMGEKVCNIIISSGGSLVISRNVDIAGNKITEVFSRGMNIAKEKAEELKLSMGMTAEMKFGIDILKPTLGAIIAEIKRSVEIFNKNYSPETPVYIILTGGTSQMIGLREYIEKEMAIKTIIGNPWSQITYPEKLEKVLFGYSTSFSVAAGLGLLGFEQKNKK